eukprot:jgi/Bigna1/89480/estExt_fgenesh1_pg.C_500028
MPSDHKSPLDAQDARKNWPPSFPLITVNYRPLNWKNRHCFLHKRQLDHLPERIESRAPSSNLFRRYEQGGVLSLKKTRTTRTRCRTRKKENRFRTINMNRMVQISMAAVLVVTFGAFMMIPTIFRTSSSCGRSPCLGRDLQTLRKSAPSSVVFRTRKRLLPLNNPSVRTICEGNPQNLKYSHIPRSSVVDGVAGGQPSSIAGTVMQGTKHPLSAGIQANLMPENERPGVVDKEWFQFDESASFWQPFDPKTSDTTEELFSKIRESIKTPQDAAYWAYSLGRTGFFVGTAVLGALYSQTQGSAPSDFTSDLLKSTSDANGGLLGNVQRDVINTQLWNLKWIHEGKFKMPYDMNPRHRQFNPRFLGSLTQKAMAEMSNILKKRLSDEGTADTDVWITDDKQLYPDYYRKTFHFQTDGWMSSNSAEIYEHMTEIIFSGKQDSMQRTTLVPFAEFMDKQTESTTLPPKVLEIAAGTGRFATFLKDSFPNVDLTVSDLSPFYLEKARENMKYWASLSKQTTTNNSPTRFIQSAAEALGVEDASQDCVISVYLFHELPPEARRKVVKEVARVLKPGGTFILTDSVQLGDRLALDESLGNFEKLNEPWYPSYIKENFGQMLSEEGFKPEVKYMNSVTKTLSFTRL